MKKRMLAWLGICAAGVVMSGCSANATGTTATTAPTAAYTSAPITTPQAAMQPTAEPVMTAAPMGTAADAMTPAQAGRLAEQISEAVERISEVSDAEVIVRDDRAIVAVEFEPQYSAGLDERMKETITQAVQKVDDGLTDVRITDDGTLYGQVKNLAERLGQATGFDELADDIGSLWDRITGM